MFIKNTSILIVFISLGTHNIIQAEIIRGVDVPRVNVSGIVGKWYRLSTDIQDETLACSSSVIEQLSDDSYRMNLTHTFKPEAKKNNPHIPDGPVETVITVTLLKDSSIMVGRSGNGDGGSTVIFDFDYDSYLAVYLTNKTEEIADGTNDNIMIVGRQTTLPDGILEKVKQSNFYNQGTPHGYELLSYDTSSCE